MSAAPPHIIFLGLLDVFLEVLDEVVEAEHCLPLFDAALSSSLLASCLQIEYVDLCVLMLHLLLMGSLSLVQLHLDQNGVKLIWCKHDPIEGRDEEGNHSDEQRGHHEGVFQQGLSLWCLHEVVEVDMDCQLWAIL